MTTTDTERFRLEISSTTDGDLLFVWRIMEHEFGRWFPVRSGACSTAPLAVERASHVLEEERERARRDDERAAREGKICRRCDESEADGRAFADGSGFCVECAPKEEA